MAIEYFSPSLRLHLQVWTDNITYVKAFSLAFIVLLDDGHVISFLLKGISSCLPMEKLSFAFREQRKEQNRQNQHWKYIGYHNHAFQEKSKLPLILLKGKFHRQATYAETAESNKKKSASLMALAEEYKLKGSNVKTQ